MVHTWSDTPVDITLWWLMSKQQADPLESKKIQLFQEMEGRMLDKSVYVTRIKLRRD